MKHCQTVETGHSCPLIGLSIYKITAISRLTLAVFFIPSKIFLTETFHADASESIHKLKYRKCYINRIIIVVKMDMYIYFFYWGGGAAISHSNAFP